MLLSCSLSCMRISMDLTDSRKTTKYLVDSRKYWHILTVSPE